MSKGGLQKTVDSCESGIERPSGRKVVFHHQIYSSNLSILHPVCLSHLLGEKAVSPSQQSQRSPGKPEHPPPSFSILKFCMHSGLN